MTEVGSKVDVGKSKLYYKCMGRNNGNPTVVLESGYGFRPKRGIEFKKGYLNLLKLLHMTGRGWDSSEEGDKTRLSKQMVEDLYSLLLRAHIDPPFILVGHSFGGLNVRLFANTYPDLVAGLVLIDPSHEDQEDKWVPFLSDESKKLYKELCTKEGTRDDFLKSLEQVRISRRPLGDLPLMILSAGRKDIIQINLMRSGFNCIKTTSLTLSSRHSHVIVENSGHNIHLEHPEKVIDAIRKIAHIAKHKIKEYRFVTVDFW